MDIDSSQSQHNTKCVCNPKVPQHKSPNIVCTDCSTSVQVACMLNQYKLSLPKQETLKNTQKWLHGFIVFTGLRYRCATSQQRSRDGNGISQNGSFDSMALKKLVSCTKTLVLYRMLSLASQGRSLNLHRKSAASPANRKCRPMLDQTTNLVSLSPIMAQCRLQCSRQR